MGIDPISKRPPVPAPSHGETVPGSARTDSTFSVPGASSPASVPPAKVSLVDPLRAGTLSVDAYVEAKVLEATEHLQLLPAADLASVRAMLRERLSADPTLVELVRVAAGSTPGGAD